MRPKVESLFSMPVPKKTAKRKTNKSKSKTTKRKSKK